MGEVVEGMYCSVYHCVYVVVSLLVMNVRSTRLRKLKAFTLPGLLC